MSSVKVKFRPSEANDGRGMLYYQITHNRYVRRITTDYIINADEWDSRGEYIIYGSDVSRRAEIAAIRASIKCDIERIMAITREMEECGLQFSTDDIISEFRNYMIDAAASVFIQRQIDKLNRIGRVRTAQTYSTAGRSFAQFLMETTVDGADDIRLDRITSDIMKDYEGWLLNRGLMLNTVSFYIRILRAIYNKAVEDGYTPDRKPFRRVYTGIARTVKRAAAPAVLKALRDADLTARPVLDYCRDMFLMSFYLRGMSFVDMSRLRHSDLKNGILVYSRRKTGRTLSIAWTVEMQQIVDKYPRGQSGLLLPIIRDGLPSQDACHRETNRINRGLKRLGRELGIAIPLTLYVARHSWASIAENIGIPIGVISRSLGHASELTTRIYLAGIDTATLDNANSQVISQLL